ncbi:MAG: hypothetical protein GC157_08720 [Frankiales bacterium]|nr:hypothetical protein [Frankiales bacterium]
MPHHTAADDPVTGPVGAPAAGEPGREVVPVVHRAGPRMPAAVEVPLDVALGAAVVVARPVLAAGSVVRRTVGPVARVGLALLARPPLVHPDWTPAALAQRLGDRGRQVRFAAGADVTAAGNDALDLLVPAVMGPVLDRVDITGIVLERVDLERLVVAVLDSMELTDVVLDRVDLQRIVESAIASIDLTEIVRSRVDLAGLAEDVIEEVDLPEIIRESSTGVAAEVVDQARLSAVAGDELVNRWVDRIMLRRKARRTTAPGAEARAQEEVRSALREAEREEQRQISDASGPQPRDDGGGDA